MTLDLNPNQKKAAHAPNKPLLIVAGAGTGKTKTLTSRILHLIAEGVPPGRICALTFTNKAAKEMLERVETQLPDPLRAASRADRPFIGTFHSFGARILRVEAKHLGRTSRFVIYDDHDSAALVRRIMKAAGTTKEDEGASFFLNRISRLKNGIATPADLEESRHPNDKLALKIYAEYEKELAANNAFDFDDLLVKVVELWKKNPSVLGKYQKRYQYVLVDEYQDINNTQYEFIRLLAGASRQLSVVGDDQQTIYSWRGSNFEIFLNFEKDWPESQVVVLDQNYRSSGNIIAAASALIAKNRRQKPKQLWTEKEEGEKVKIVETSGEDEEAYWIGEKILQTEARPRKSTAILYRTNAQSRALEQALIERGIPYLVFGGLKFYERREIKDLVAALRLALNPEDSVSRERLEKELGKIRTRALASALAGRGEESPAPLIPLIVKAVDYFAYLDKNFTNSAERKENVMELTRFATQFGELSEFLEQITLLQATDTVKNYSADAPPVYLMTIHLAKGLEFDRVFVAGVTEGILPHAFSLETEAETEEERRLMYVAMTRAREELFLMFYDLPSRFIGEIPQEHVSYESTISDDDYFSDGEERYITLD